MRGKVFVLTAAIMLLAICASAVAEETPKYRWVHVTEKAAFAPRDGAGALAFGGRMWFIGGWNPGDKVNFPLICNNEVWSSADGADWKLEKPNTFLDKSFDAKSDWEGRHTAGYAVLGDRMYIVGGDANQKHYQNDVWSSADGRVWRLEAEGEAALPWCPRNLHYTVAYKDKLWVIGGQTMPAFAGGDEKFYRDVWTSEDGRTWKEVKIVEPAWEARGMIGGAAVFKDRIWLLGGGTYDTPDTPDRKFFHDVWSTSDGAHWKKHADAPWAARQYHDVAVFDDRLWVMEGYSGANRNDVWFSADGETWKELKNTPWKPRHAASVFVFDDALWMVAGNNMESDVWKLVRN